MREPEVNAVLNRIYRVKHPVEVEGFYGNEDTPVVVDWFKMPALVLYKLEHAHHTDGTCKKNRFGPYCERET